MRKCLLSTTKWLLKEFFIYIKNVLELFYFELKWHVYSEAQFLCGPFFPLHYLRSKSHPPFVVRHFVPELIILLVTKFENTRVKYLKYNRSNFAQILLKIDISYGERGYSAVLFNLKYKCS